MQKITFKMVGLFIAIVAIGTVGFKMFTTLPTTMSVEASVEELYSWAPSYPDNQRIALEGHGKTFLAKDVKRLPLHEILHQGDFVDIPTFFQKLGKRLPRAHDLSKVSADIVVFSYNRPMQLYAFLESATKLISGYRTIHVVYRASSSDYEKGYALVKTDFPFVHFQHQEGPDDFQKLTLNSLTSDYVAFSVDDIIVKDHIDLKESIRLIQQTGAYGYYYRLGHHLSYCQVQNKPQAVPKTIPVEGETFAWQFSGGELDWAYPNSLDMTLYRTSDIKKTLTSLNYNNPSRMETVWSERANLSWVGLFSTLSKVVNIPLNVVTTEYANPTAKEYSPEELLVAFLEGYKINIDSVYHMKNPSAHAEVDVDFILR